MGRISSRVRIAMGLCLLLVSVLLLAISFGIVPDELAATLRGRAALCEAIAVQDSAFVSRGDWRGLDATLRAVVQRNPDFLSAAVRQQNGKLVVEVGEHDAHWHATGVAADAAAESNVYVPVWANDKQWGTVELRFRPVSRGGMVGFLMGPQSKLVLFVTFGSLGAFLAYLKRTLQHLDPSKVVPPHVRAALDTLAEGVLVIDPEGRVALANKAFADIAGRTAEKLVGSRVAKLPWGEEAGGGTEGATREFPWVRAMKEGTPQRNLTLHLSDAAGERRTFVVNCAPILNNRGVARGVLASFDDVTQLERNEIELRKSKNAAEAANQTKSEFLARMSHEIRTPMNAILGFADILRRGYEENEAERQEYLDTIHSSGQHLLELINDILDLSKIESGKLEIELTRCSPHKILSDVVSVLGVRARERGLELALAWDGPAPQTILTDPTRFCQVITNLVGNALKFTEKGGVRLSARLDCTSARPRLVVDVIDSGIGMKPDALGRIFNPFTQADNSITRRFGGTGLGLSISRQCATALGGELTVRSEFGKGSTFTLTVDAGPAEGITLHEPDLRDTVRETKAPTTLQLPLASILVVEDGTSNQKLIRVVLQRAGVKVELAENGQIGVDKALAGQYDVILMDMQMPVMDGFTATRLLRQRGVRTPIVALTANAMMGEEQKCRAAGCTGYISKPIDMDLLLRTLAGLLGERAARAPQVRQAVPAAPVPPKAPPAASPPAARALPALKSSLPMDDEDFREIVEEFVGRLREKLALMVDAWGRRDFDQLAAVAHWLKGSGGTAGFNAFTAPAARLEQLAKAKAAAEIPAALADLQDLSGRIVLARPAAAVAA